MVEASEVSTVVAALPTVAVLEVSTVEALEVSMVEALVVSTVAAVTSVAAVTLGAAGVNKHHPT